MSQRPASEQYLKDATPTTVFMAPSPDQSALKAAQIRPKSEVLAEHKISSPEAEALEKWFQDLTQYERTLEEMAKASLEPSFKEELGAVENWFSALSEAERTAALYSLIHQSTNVQIRFFITVLQKMTKDPADLTSPALTLNDGLLSRRKINERNSLQLSHAENSNFFAAKSPTISRLSTNRISQINDSKLKSSSGDSIDLRNSSWERTSNLARFSNGGVRNKNVPNIDVTAATNWGKDDLNDPDRPKTASWHSNTVYLDSPGNRPRSATHNGDPSWGNLNADKVPNSAKSRNPNNLTLKVDNVEVKLDSPHWPTSGRNLPLKSPAAPPGLYPAMSPISWAATPTEPIHQIRSPRLSESKPAQVQPQPVSDEAPKEPKPLDPVDFEVLESIPAWMRSLRLHKYTALFESMTWREVINLSDEKLTELGVSALGARRKFLKVFEHVKNEAQAKVMTMHI